MGFLRRLFGGGASEPRESRSLVAQSMNELRLKTEAHDGVWRFGEAHWNVEQEAGVRPVNWRSASRCGDGGR